MPNSLTVDQITYFKNKFASRDLSVDELNEEFQNGKMTTHLYAFYMDLLGAEDQVTDQKAKKYFYKTVDYDFTPYVITPYDYSQDPD